MKTTNKNIKIAATGIYIPDNSYDNEAIMDRIRQALPSDDPRLQKLSAQWVTNNIGIKSRYYADMTRDENPETHTNMSTWSLESALENAGWSADELDLVIVSTSTKSASPGINSIPSVASQVQSAIGAWNASAYDMSAACSGWTYASSQAFAYMISGMAKKVAVICTETQERGLDYTNPTTSVLFGDVSATTLFEVSEKDNLLYTDIQGNTETDDPNIIRCQYANIWGDPGHTRSASFGLDGKTVFKTGIKRMCKMTKDALESAGLEKEEVQHYIFHQANGAMILHVGTRLGLDPSQVPINLDTFANTTSGTIPSVLHCSIESGRIKRGDKVMFISFGGGITAGAVLMEY